MFGPSVIGYVPVICACWAMSTEGSRAMDDGLGSIDMRFGAVDDRRSGPGRAGVGCEDMVRRWMSESDPGGMKAWSLSSWKTRRVAYGI